MTMMGESLKRAEKQHGARGPSGGGTRGSQKEPQPEASPTLADSGISEKGSRYAQALVEVEVATPATFGDDGAVKLITGSAGRGRR
jgi:hypothetical protein